MASPAIMYFAGVGTVVAALGLGFGGGVMLVTTEPVQKHDAAAFARRELPAEQPAAQATAVAATAAVSSPAAATQPAVSVATVEPPAKTEPTPIEPAAAIVTAPVKKVADVSNVTKVQPETNAAAAPAAERVSAIRKSAQRKAKKPNPAIARKKVPNEELDEELIARDRSDPDRDVVVRNRRLVDPEDVERRLSYSVESEPRRDFLFGLFGDQ